MLSESGVVIQKNDGSLEAVTPEEAQEMLRTMSPEKRDYMKRYNYSNVGFERSCFPDEPT